MQLLFHLTSGKSVERILTEGLRVNYKLEHAAYSFTSWSKRTDLIPVHGMIPLFFCDDPIRLANEQLTTSFVARVDTHVLTVDLEGFVLIDEYAHITWRPADYKPHTWIVQHDVPSDRIVAVNKFTSLARLLARTSAFQTEKWGSKPQRGTNMLG